ncbi:MAG TPA: hypothetical protein VNF68_03195 [Candidatus Baltobacteraceae bacterium]|nr:hypothetical protein [Candidatus Baltobacteraceae bacterium]
MSTLLEIHEVVAFLAALCAIIFSWNARGRRVVSAVVALQFVLGLAIAAVMGAQHLAMPALLWLHLLIGIAVLAAYGLAMRFGKQAGGASTTLALSVAGLVLILVNIYLGLQMAGMLPS